MVIGYHRILTVVVLLQIVISGDVSVEAVRCPDGLFQCNTGSCIPEALRCDGEPNCPFRDDENTCGTIFDYFEPTYQALVNDSSKIGRVVPNLTKQACAEHCLEEADFLCLSFDYDSDTSDCRLSNAEYNVTISQTDANIEHWDIVNFPDCGSALLAETGNLATPRWILDQPDGDCDVTISRAAEDAQITVDFTAVAPTTGSNCSSSFSEVKIYGGLNATPLTPIIGEYCLETLPSSVNADTNAVLITYREINKPSDVVQGFVGSHSVEYRNTEYLTSSPGVVTSPAWPSAYTPNRQYFYEFDAGATQRVRLNFTAFSLEPDNPGCIHDHDILHIYDGQGPLAPLIGVYCGTDIDQIITSSDRYLHMRFKSDDDVEFPGFRAEYEFLSSPRCSDGRFQCSTGTCIPESLRCDGAPNCRLRDDETSCVTNLLHFEPTYGAKLSDDNDIGRRILNSTAVDCANSCLQQVDFLCLSFDFDNDNSECILSNSVEYPVSISETENNIEHWDINDYQGCGVTFSADKGKLASPRWIQTQADGDCDISISITPPSTDASVRINFDSVLTPIAADDCTNSYSQITIYDGSTSSSPILGQFCLETLPRFVDSNGGDVLITYRETNKPSDVAQGFVGSYRTEYTDSQNYTSAPGAVTSPGWPSDYTPNRIYTYSFDAGENHVVKLNFTSFSLEPDNPGCIHNYDTLTIYDGQGQLAAVLGVYCGSEVDDVIYSTGRYLYMVFQSDDTVQYPGFSAEYDFVSDPRVCAQDQFQCRDVEELCIPETQRCDGYGQCPFLDDEVQCGTNLEFFRPVYNAKIRYQTDIDRVLNNTTRQRCAEICLSETAFVCYGFNYIPGGPESGRLGGTCTISRASQSPVPYVPDETGLEHWELVAFPNCDSLLTAERGVIASPRWIQADTGGWCLLRFSQNDADAIVTVNFLYILSSNGESSCGDNYERILLRDGLTGTSPIIDAYCFETLPLSVRSPGNQISLEYGETTRPDDVYLGFLATFSITYESNLVIDAGPGEIFSPNWPNNYPPNRRYTWTFQATGQQTQQIVQLNFTDFFLEDDDYLCSSNLDTVSFHDGSSEQSPFIGSYCGRNSPGVVRSSGSSLHMIFKSDVSVEETGFRCFYDFETETVTVEPTTTSKPTFAPSPTTAMTTADSKPTTKPTTTKPVTIKPTTAKPTTTKPVTMKPTTAEPTTAKPATTTQVDVTTMDATTNEPGPVKTTENQPPGKTTTSVNPPKTTSPIDITNAPSEVSDEYKLAFIIVVSIAAFAVLIVIILLIYLIVDNRRQTRMREELRIKLEEGQQLKNVPNGGPDQAVIAAAVEIARAEMLRQTKEQANGQVQPSQLDTNANGVDNSGFVVGEDSNTQL